MEDGTTSIATDIAHGKHITAGTAPDTLRVSVVPLVIADHSTEKTEVVVVVSQTAAG